MRSRTAPHRFPLRSRAALILSAVLLALSADAVAPAAQAHAASSDEISWGVAPSDNTIGKGRPNFTYTLSGGTQITDSLVISNESAQTLTLKVYAADGYTTSSGALDLKKPEQRSVDVGAWVEVGKNSVTLQPHTTASVPFTLTVPSNASPGDHTGGVVTSLASGNGAGALNLDRRLGSRILLRVPGTVRPALEVSHLRLDFAAPANPFAGGTATVTYRVTNTGNVRLAAAQQIAVAGPLGILLKKASTANVPELLPGATLTRTAVVSGVVASGWLTADVTLKPYSDSGGEPIAVPSSSATAHLWVFPWGALIAAVLLAAAVTAPVWVRRRRRSARATTGDREAPQGAA